MSKRLEKAKQDHERYLLSMGVHPSQLRVKKSTAKIYKPRGSFKRVEDKVFLEDIAAYRDTGAVRGIMANIHNEPKHVQEKILALKSRVVPLYNKGGLQVMTDTENKNFDQIGHKTRRM